MQRDADEIFRVKDLSMLKSPVPGHLRKPSSSPSAVGQSPSNTRPSPGIPLLARPTPKPMGPPPARPRATPLMRTPATVSKTLFPLSTSSTPLANRKAAPLVHEGVSSLVATPIIIHRTIDKNDEAIKEDVHDNGNVENIKEEDNGYHNSATEEKQRELTDSIFNDIVDSTKLQEDTKEDNKEEDTDNVQVEVVEEEAPTKRRKRNTPPTSTAPLPAPVSVAVDDQVRAEVSKDVNETANNTGTSVADLVANGNGNVNETANINKSEQTIPATVPAPAMPINSKEYTIDKWYLQRIPNNPKFSGIPKDSSDEWVVLVGNRTDTGELWHSSIVSGSESATRVMTGSGRLYILKAIDSDAFSRADFPKTLVDRFAKGFPERWQDLLLAHIGHAKAPVSPPRTTGKLLKMPVQPRTPKTPKTPKSAKTVKRTPKRTPRTPKTPKSKEQFTPQILGSTRSGRKVVTPIPFWDTNVLSSAYKPSPTVLVKRRWGNRNI